MDVLFVMVSVMLAMFHRIVARMFKSFEKKNKNKHESRKKTKGMILITFIPVLDDLLQNDDLKKKKNSNSNNNNKSSQSLHKINFIY